MVCKMFGLFGKGKDKKKGTQTAQEGDVDVSHLSDAKQQLFAQLQAKRQELGADTIAKLQQAAKMDKLKNQIKNDIDTDEAKRDRLLDEIRFGLKDKD